MVVAGPRENGVSLAAVMEPTHLRNPPIVEAMIELRVERRPDLEPARLGSIRDGLEARFPVLQGRMEMQLLVPFPFTGQATASQQGIPGLLLFSESRDRAAQVSPERFAFSRLRSYTSWDELKGESLELWQRYVAVAAPKRVVGITVRFINRLDLPLADSTVDDFLLAFPQIPLGMPPMTRSIMQTVMFDQESGAEVHVTQTISPTPETSTFAVGFDIQALLAVDEAPDSAALWTRLDVLRSLKNRIFFGSFTERAMESYR